MKFDFVNLSTRWTLCGMTAAACALAGLNTLALGRRIQPPACTILVDQPRVVVLKSRRILHLFDGGRLVRSYPIDLGFAPEGDKRLAGDGRTPEGRFRVVTKNPASPYHRFLGIDYPDFDAISEGRRHRHITPGEAAAISWALAEGVCPDWSTPLGGGVGIHGHRQGWDWTAGCVALADDHVTELFDALRIGDPIEILP